MPTEYTLSELAKLSGVTSRTVRFYISEGLLPGPLKGGAGARYSDVHLERLRLIKRLQAAHLPLAEIRRRLESMPTQQLTETALSAASERPADSALDYIQNLLGGKRDETLYAIAVPPPAAPPTTTPQPAMAPPRLPEPSPATEPEREHWERIPLDPDIEIHVRRPLSRLQNKRVERLISIARQLLEED